MKHLLAAVSLCLTAATATAQVTRRPSGKIAWDWQIGASTEAKIMPPPGIKLIDVDGFNTSTATVSSLRAKSIYPVCYIDAGSWEPDRPDANEYPEYLKIYYDSSWGEWFLDVTDVFKPNSVLAKILRARFKMCKDKGFAALEPDNQQNDENAGGKITKQEQINFNGWVADEAHKAGLAVFQKNGPDNILLKTSTDGVMMVDKFDAILNEQCQQYQEYGPLAEYVRRGKLALNVEYRKKVPLDCATSAKLNANFMGKDLDLVGAGQRGYLRIVCP